MTTSHFQSDPNWILGWSMAGCRERSLKGEEEEKRKRMTGEGEIRALSVKLKVKRREAISDGGVTAESQSQKRESRESKGTRWG